MRFEGSTTLKRVLLAVMFGLVTVLAACTPTPPPAQAPVIRSFVATPDTVTSGEDAVLSWRVTGTTSDITVRVQGGDTVASGLAATGTRSVSPDATTTYELVATWSGGTVVADVTVSVVDAPVEPVITQFEATPASIAAGGESTLSWSVTGSVTDVTLRVQGGADLASGLAAAGSQDVSPDATTTYELVATWAEGAVLADTTVTVAGDPVMPTIDSATAELAIGSQFTVSWVASDADTFTVVAVNPDDDEDVVELASGIAGTESSATLAIPDSGHQLIRVIATSAAGSVESDAGVLTNVVLNALDYDPYSPDGPDGGEEPIAGTLRQVLDDAPAGSIIGFAADVVSAGTIELPGVLVGTWGDAHLYINKEVRISGPEAGIVFLGSSAWEPGDPGDEFTWRSRVMHVHTGGQVVLDNITLTGGTFIYAGAGVRNLGHLTMNGGAVTGNRAWSTGGGIYNGGTLVLNGTEVSGNIAATLDGEVGPGFAIRGNPTYPTGAISAGGWGGGIYNANGGNATLNDVSVSGNNARRTGGGLNNTSGGTLVVNGGSVDGNDVNDAQYVDGTGSGSHGGGIYTEGTLTITDTEVSGNDAQNIGGGIGARLPGSGTVVTSLVTGNSAEYSGGVHVWHCSTASPDDVLTIAPSSITGNTASLGEDDYGKSPLSCPGVGPDGIGARSGGLDSPFQPSAAELDRSMSR